MQRAAVHSVGQRSWFAILLQMDVGRIIEDIEQLEEMFEAPDIRPLSASDVSAANQQSVVPAMAGLWYLLPAREPDALGDREAAGLSSPDFASNLNSNGVVGRSSPQAITQPIKPQDSSPVVAKPSLYVLFGERAIARAELLVQQFCNLFRRARSLDLVQGSSQLFVESGIRIRRLSHLLFSRPIANLIGKISLSALRRPQ